MGEPKRYGEYVDRNSNTAPGATLEELAKYFPEPHNAIRTELARDLLEARARIKELEQKLRDADAYADELNREAAGLSDMVTRS